MTRLSKRLLQPLIRRALQEDGAGRDITTRALLPREARSRAHIVARQAGVAAGIQVAQWVFQEADHRIRYTARCNDGRAVRAGQILITLAGPTRSILAAERTTLNLLGHLSGIATLTRRFVQRAGRSSVAIMDTRKTLPGLRLLEKYAVCVGGGKNHRFGLHDAVLIKTNHLRALKRGERAIRQAVAKAKTIRPRRFVEIEVVTLRDFNAAFRAKPDAILLDNWPLASIRKAVALRNRSRRRAPLLEVSGGVTLQNVRRIAKTGVERISIGALTHSAPALDVSLQVR